SAQGIYMEYGVNAGFEVSASYLNCVSNGNIPGTNLQGQLGPMVVGPLEQFGVGTDGSVTQCMGFGIGEDLGSVNLTKTTEAVGAITPGTGFTAADAKALGYTDSMGPYIPKNPAFP